MNEANLCPKCGTYIIGTYCYECKEDIKSMDFNYNKNDSFTNFFNDIINKGNKK